MEEKNGEREDDVDPLSHDKKTEKSTKYEKLKEDEEEKEEEEEVHAAKSMYRFITDNFTNKYISLVFLVLGTEVMQILYKWWLGVWTKNEDESQTLFYIIGLFTIFFVQIVISYLRSTSMKGTGYEIGNKVHAKFLNTLFKSPMGWFDEKPIG